ncbi:MAG: HAMP domain-containing histidine kinase, partial [Clostridia bacterium]|nr:HAMP domain-containing histidine kinase [Clostridia bacterium]
LLGLLAAVFAGFLIARRISAPLHEVTSLTEEIAGGNYAIRLTSRTAIQEVDVLKQSVNLMADRLQADKENARRLTSDVAHELRTPLSNMHSYLEAMEEGVWEPTTERIGACRKEAERITGLVGQLETLHRSETALQSSAPESVDLIRLCQSVSDTFSRQMDARDVHCGVVGESLTLPVEKEKLIQVLTNLLGNAVKYSPDHAEITLRVAREKQGASISVEDHGIGIPPADLPHIFERFYRTDLSRSRQTGGAGIGLSIVQAIVQSQGWEIRVQSEEGIGSTFTVLLPGVPA